MEQEHNTTKGKPAPVLPKKRHSTTTEELNDQISSEITHIMKSIRTPQALSRAIVMFVSTRRDRTGPLPPKWVKKLSEEMRKVIDLLDKPVEKLEDLDNQIKQLAREERNRTDQSDTKVSALLYVASMY